MPRVKRKGTLKRPKPEKTQMPHASPYSTDGEWNKDVAAITATRKGGANR